MTANEHVLVEVKPYCGPPAQCFRCPGIPGAFVASTHGDARGDRAGIVCRACAEMLLNGPGLGPVINPARPKGGA